jgi:hypothetical protein
MARLYAASRVAVALRGQPDFSFPSCVFLDTKNGQTPLKGAFLRAGKRSKKVKKKS